MDKMLVVIKNASELQTKMCLRPPPLKKGLQGYFLYPKGVELDCAKIGPVVSSLKEAKEQHTAKTDIVRITLSRRTP
jgi:hypothetical protein